MTEWWETAYPGGGPVKVKGFPRPLYPPDVPNSSGYDPSPNGPDVVAYKRAISRLGRWPWQIFDEAYSNGFAHGTSGNVKDTGIEGFQRQMHIDASGWWGKASFNTLSGSLGFKVNVVNRLLLDANLLFALDNHGVRDKVTPLIGFEYSF